MVEQPKLCPQVPVAAVTEMTVKPVIHVGVDGSWRDTGALEWALQECLLRREPLHAVHVIEEKLRRAPGWEPDAVDDASMELVDQVQKYLDESAGRLDHEADLRAGHQPGRWSSSPPAAGCWLSAGGAWGRSNAC